MILGLDEVSSCLGLVDISKHLQTDQVEVVHNLRFWVFNVHTLDVSEDSNLYCLPVLVEDISCIRLMTEQKSDKIDQSNLVLIFGDLNQLHKLIKGFAWDSLKLNGAEPSDDVARALDFFDCFWRLSEVSNELLHLI